MQIVVAWVITTIVSYWSLVAMTGLPLSRPTMNLPTERRTPVFTPRATNIRVPDRQVLVTSAKVALRRLLVCMQRANLPGLTVLK